VGAYTSSPSEYATFDQGGNVLEWNEAIIAGSRRGLRGDGFLGVPSYVAASFRAAQPGTLEQHNIGFRVAMIPEPTTALLLAVGIAGSQR
jgi:formylglycine-generating enzyme required for sulfatase activity